MEIPLDMLNKIEAQSRLETPEEACGAIVGGSGFDLELIPMNNDHENPCFYYRFDPQAWVLICHILDDQGKRPLVIYHSHPHGDSYPSISDIAGSIEGMLYLIYSPKGFSLWEIKDKQYVIEEPIVIA